MGQDRYGHAVRGTGEAGKLQILSLPINLVQSNANAINGIHHRGDGPITAVDGGNAAEPDRQVGAELEPLTIASYYPQKRHRRLKAKV